MDLWDSGLALATLNMERLVFMLTMAMGISYMIPTLWGIFFKVYTHCKQLDRDRHTFHILLRTDILSTNRLAFIRVRDEQI